MGTTDNPQTGAETVLSEKIPGSRPSTDNDTAEDTAVESIGDTGDAGKEQPADATEPEQEYLEGFQLVIVTAAVTLVCFLVLLDTSILATAIPRITDEFHSLPDVGWYVGAYQLAGSALQPLAGKLYTYLNNKYTFMAFFAVFELGSLLCGVATSSTMLIVGRAVAGLGMSGLFNGGITIIASSTPLHKRAALMGFLMGFCQLGVVSGPLLGGAFTEYTTWRWCFYINLPVGGLVTIFLLFVRIPDYKGKPLAADVLPKLHHLLDLVGFAVFAGAALQILLALQWGGVEHPWKSATTIGLLIGGAATFVVWGVWNSRKGEAALIPFALVKKRAVWSAALTQLFLFTNLFITSYFLPIFFQAVKGATPFMAGVYVLPSILSQLVVSVVSGVLVGKLGYYMPWALVAGILSSIAGGLLSTLGPDSSTGMWIGYQILGGIGRGCGMQMPILALQANIKPSEVAVGQSFLSFSQFLGVAVFLVIGNTIFGEVLRSRLAEYAPDLNSEAVIAAGATAFRKFVPPADLPGVLLAYAKADNATFYLGAASAALAFVTAWGMGWVDIRQKKPPAMADV